MDRVVDWIKANKAFLGWLFGLITAALAAAGVPQAAQVTGTIAAYMLGAGYHLPDRVVRIEQDFKKANGTSAAPPKKNFYEQ